MESSEALPVFILLLSLSALCVVTDGKPNERAHARLALVVPGAAGFRLQVPGH